MKEKAKNINKIIKCLEEAKKDEELTEMNISKEQTGLVISSVFDDVIEEETVTIELKYRRKRKKTIFDRYSI